MKKVILYIAASLDQRIAEPDGSLEWLTGIDKQREYLSEILNDINRYNHKRLDFIRYYRSGSSSFDSLYFLRGQANTEQYMETFSHEFDPSFSTNCDFKVAKILSNDMLSVHLMREIEALNDS